MSNDQTWATVQGSEMIMKRVFNAPRDVVFKAWTDPAQLIRWWGPRGYTITHRETDIRPGGVWRYIMHGPDQADYDNKISYLELTSPERIVYKHGDDQDDEHFRVTVTFEERDGKTELTMRSQFKSAADLEYVVREFGALEGGKQTLQRLDEHLQALR